MGEEGVRPQSPEMAQQDCGCGGAVCGVTTAQAAAELDEASPQCDCGYEARIANLAPY